MSTLNKINWIYNHWLITIWIKNKMSTHNQIHTRNQSNECVLLNCWSLRTYICTHSDMYIIYIYITFCRRLIRTQWQKLLWENDLCRPPHPVSEHLYPVQSLRMSAFALPAEYCQNKPNKYQNFIIREKNKK